MAECLREKMTSPREQKLICEAQKKRRKISVCNALPFIVVSFYYSVLTAVMEKCELQSANGTYCIVAGYLKSYSAVKRGAQT